MRPIFLDPEGVVRFRPNPIVRYLTKGRLNELAEMDFAREDWEELYQLIGYSIDGYCDLSLPSEASKDIAKIFAEHLLVMRTDDQGGEPASRSTPEGLDKTPKD